MNPANLTLSFDVGHSSIGWAVLRTDELINPEVLGCGAVTFRSDDCLASSRRSYRRQRRHIRSTRQRIRRLASLLAYLKVLSPSELSQPGSAWPWQLAGRVLAGKTGGNPKLLLSWAELWDVLRWYAHNRGYDGNRRWSSSVVESHADDDDTQKVENARTLLKKHSVNSMAEAVCAELGIDPLGTKRASHVSYKRLNAAFPREVVEREVSKILAEHRGKLGGLDEDFVRAVMVDWRAVPVPEIRVPKRYEGGLLFGQLVPRFDNRIIGRCIFSGEKLPLKSCREFRNFRWAMQLANVQVAAESDKTLRRLTSDERRSIDQKIRGKGYFTAKQFKDAVRATSQARRDNLDALLLHPDAEDALVVDEVQKRITSDDLDPFWRLLPERIQKRAAGKLRSGKPLSLGLLGSWLQSCARDVVQFNSAIDRRLDELNTRAKKKEMPIEREGLLSKLFSVAKLTGRAPYSRPVLARVYDEVIGRNDHPSEPGGCLFRSEEIRAAELNRSVTEQTNNHLVRHRLLVLQRLFRDIVAEYAANEPKLIQRVVVEVNRDLREFSGKTAKEKAQDFGLRIANHHAVAAKLEKAFEGKSIAITAGLIRKARVAEDLGWKCPYTGQIFEPIDLVTKLVDKDHVVPRSLRAADGLDSLVITFCEVNRMKGKRTAWQFVAEEQGKPVEGRPNLSIMSLVRYRQFVDGLETFKGHEDDKRRKRRRKELLLLPSYESKEFVPRDLTQTSQLVRLAAQVLRREFSDSSPQIISLPGSVTAEVRKSWSVAGCLATASPQALDSDGRVRTKTELRDISHLHHAVDACVLALGAHFIPNNGRTWELVLKRRLTKAEQAELMRCPLFGIDSDGRCQLQDLADVVKEQIRQRLAERRVVQHVPSRMDGLRVEQNTWRVVGVKDGKAQLEQRMRSPDGSRLYKQSEENVVKLLGLSPANGDGKLRVNKGVLIIPDNYGVALDPTPTIIPFHKVWQRLSDLKAQNNGRWPRVLRNGQMISVPKGSYQGVWRIFSAKNTSFGIALDIGRPDVVRLQNKIEGHKINVRLTTLMKDGLTAVESSLVGVAACPTTLSA